MHNSNLFHDQKRYDAMKDYSWPKDNIPNVVISSHWMCASMTRIFNNCIKLRQNLQFFIIYLKHLLNITIMLTIYGQNGLGHLFLWDWIECCIILAQRHNWILWINKRAYSVAVLNIFSIYLPFKMYFFICNFQSLLIKRLKASKVSWKKTLQPKVIIQN